MIETDRLIAPAAENPQEEALERALRPKVLDEYVGQEKARAQLEIFINAARGRAEALDHVLLFGLHIHPTLWGAVRALAPLLEGFLQRGR